MFLIYSNYRILRIILGSIYSVKNTGQARKEQKENIKYSSKTLCQLYWKKRRSYRSRVITQKYFYHFISSCNKLNIK